MAGPNGSGKSSFYQTLEFEASARSIWIINPDLLTVRLQQVEGLELLAANLQAVKRIENWLDVSIRAHQTVGVETVLSTDKYCRLVMAAKALQFQLRLTYVILDSPERNIARVRMRVKKGGHAVPEDKIVERYARSLAQLPWFLDQADEAWLYDNSDASPRLIGRKRDGVITLDPKALPQVVLQLKRPKRHKARVSHRRAVCGSRASNQLAIVLKFLAMCSAPRSDTAMMVLVGLTAPSVGNRPPPAR